MIYRLIYEYETCFDDGGLGHDSGWNMSKMFLKSGDADSAIAEARNYIKEHNGSNACHGFGCSNKGGYRLIRVEALTPEIVRVIATH